MARYTHSKQYLLDTALIAGILKHLPSATLTIQAEPQSTAEVVGVIQARVDKALAAEAAKLAAHAAVLAAREEYSTSHAFVEDVRRTVLAMYSTSSVILGDFAMSPRKQPVPLSPEKRLIAAAKRRATRVARNTLSAKKKATIFGSLTGSIVVPVDGSGSSVTGSSTPATPPAAPSVANGTSTPHA